MQARGAVAGAISTTNTDFSVPIELKDALGLTPEGSTSTWTPRNEEYSKYSTGLVSIPVPGQFNVHEAAALVEVWNHTASLHSGKFLNRWWSKPTLSSIWTDANCIYPCQKTLMSLFS